VQGEVEIRAASRLERSAGLWLDGQYVGAVGELGGRGRLVLLPGEHELTFKLIGYEDVTSTIVVEPGERQEYRIAMTGSADAVLFAPNPVSGFANNSPNSKGWVGEVSYVPWQNVKLLAQYVAYQKFNGAGSDYDGSGRNASDNNTLYLLAWLNF